MIHQLHNFLHAHPIAFIVLIFGVCLGVIWVIILNSPVGKETENGFESNDCRDGFDRADGTRFDSLKMDDEDSDENDDEDPGPEFLNF